MERPSRINTLMAIAELMGERSTCNRLHVGALITRNARILSTGYNGPPAGLNHCNHTDSNSCDASVHAEANAIVFAARHGMGTENTTLISTHQPCLKCAQLIINSGITSVIYQWEYRDYAGLDLLALAGINVDQIRATDGN